MAREQDGCGGSIELAFDVTKTSAHVRFLGLLDRLDESDNELLGVFDWTCRSCGAPSRATVSVKPDQAFVTRWSCRSCSRLTRVQFQARASTEWTTPYRPVTTGRAFRALAGSGAIATSTPAKPSARKGANQKTFAWIAVPALLGIILLGVMDMPRVLRTSASTYLADSGQPASTPSARLAGYWVNDEGDHVVCFAAIDPVSRVGTYTVVWRGSRQTDTIRFKVLHEEVAGEQLVIREEPDEPSDEPVSRAGPAPTHAGGLGSSPSDVTIYVPKGGRSMTRIDIRQGQPVVSIYRRAGETGIP